MPAPGDLGAMVSDGLGVLGSLMIAVPFFRTQKLRDGLDLLERTQAGDEGAAKALNGARQETLYRLCIMSRQDYVTAGIGALLVAASFVAKYLL